VFNVCPGCGTYSVEKMVEPSGDRYAVAICPACGHQHPYRYLPVFSISGASGVGKTSVILGLPNVLPECVVLEMDILWRREFDRPEDDYADFRNTWLRLAKNVGQAGQPVVLGGTVVPGSFERCPEYRYIAGVRYLALVCEDDVLASRLRARPSWRKSSDSEFVERMVAFNRWLRENASTTQPRVELLDTSALTIEETVDQTASWIRRELTGLGS
jgi:hypothetical protein